MNRRTRMMITPAIFGVLAGGVLVFGVLFWLGSQKAAPPKETPSSPSPETAVTPSATPSVSLSTPTPSPTASSASRSSPEKGAVKNTEGGFSFTLPTGYRVATAITKLEQSRLPAAASMTVTKGSAAEEEEYVKLLEKLQSDQTATEAPTFFPGRTISLSVVISDNSERSDAQLARAREEVTTSGGAPATRYRRVEGLFTYDVTYIRFSGKTVAVQMTYSSDNPMFDEAAYTTVVNSIRTL